jgi:hypothetical protein
MPRTAADANSRVALILRSQFALRRSSFYVSLRSRILLYDDGRRLIAPNAHNYFINPRQPANSRDVSRQ